jgi:energy-coupling factor transporter ATP-binding protein EcfA2
VRWVGLLHGIGSLVVGYVAVWRSRCGEAMIRMDQAFPLVGLASEYNRLTTTLKKGQPLLILGPAGSGKSALITTAIANLPKTHEIISMQDCSNLHDLLINLARSLLSTGHGTFRKLARAGNDAEKWLSQQTSVHLRGILWTSLEAEPRVVVLDGVASGGFPTYRFFQRLYFAKGTALVASARDPVSLGTVGRLFWDPRNTIHLHPLNEVDANHLFKLAVARFGLGHLDVEEFRGRALEAAKGNPGQLIEMCRLASDPMYVSGTHIKFAPLRIDALMKFI